MGDTKWDSLVRFVHGLVLHGSQSTNLMMSMVYRFPSQRRSSDRYRGRNIRYFIYVCVLWFGHGNSALLDLTWCCLCHCILKYFVNCTEWRSKLIKWTPSNLQRLQFIGITYNNCQNKQQCYVNSYGYVNIENINKHFSDVWWKRQQANSSLCTLFSSGLQFVCSLFLFVWSIAFFVYLERDANRKCINWMQSTVQPHTHETL